MKLLKDILYGVNIQQVVGVTNVAVESIVFDSRKVVRHSLFVAVNGTVVDGHDYIDAAIEKGAVTVLCERLPENLKDHVSYVRVPNSAKALGTCASNFFDNPSENLKLIGVTGTNGKTTCVTMLHNLGQHLGYMCGMLSTVVNKIGDRAVEATHTTPDAVELNRLLAEMVAEGCEYCFMEVSSHAVAQYRIEGLEFKVAGFTNLSRDHLDYHETMEKYVEAKKAFFDGLKTSATALYNMDDLHGDVMVSDTKAHQYSYGLNGVADYKAKVLENQFSGLVLSIDNSELWSKLIGGFNAYNLLLIYAVADVLAWDKFEVLTALSAIDTAEGRFQYIKSEENITGIVDYAHTPDALENVLKTIAEIRTGNEKVITIVGCGGDRDKGKRPMMAEIACKYSDQVILTSDNPRSEDPDAIIADMMTGVDVPSKRKVLSITNRKEAIRTACSLAQENDILLVAGKGHEKYQIIKDEVLPFDDMEVLNESLKPLNK